MNSEAAAEKQGGNPMLWFGGFVGVSPEGIL